MKNLKNRNLVTEIQEKSPSNFVKSIKFRHPDLFEFVDKNFVDADSITEKFYQFVNGLKEKPLCIECNKKHPKFRRFSIGYLKHCSLKCSSKSKVVTEKREETTFKKHGYNNLFSNREKVKESFIKKFGVDNPAKTKEVQQKREKTCLENFGSKTPFHSENIKKKIQINRRKTFEDSGRWISLDLYDELMLYRKEVRKFTRKQQIHLLENNKHSYHLDHIFSIKEGFENYILPSIIGNIVNLRYIPAKENIQKSSNSDITKEELFELYFNNLK